MGDDLNLLLVGAEVLRMARPRFKASWWRSLVLFPTSTYRPPNQRHVRKYTAARYATSGVPARRAGKVYPAGLLPETNGRGREEQLISFGPPGPIQHSKCTVTGMTAPFATGTGPHLHL